MLESGPYIFGKRYPNCCTGEKILKLQALEVDVLKHLAIRDRRRNRVHRSAHHGCIRASMYQSQMLDLVELIGTYGDRDSLRSAIIRRLTVLLGTLLDVGHERMGLG